MQQMSLRSRLFWENGGIRIRYIFMSILNTKREVLLCGWILSEVKKKDGNCRKVK
jgi:hypothetical protein